MLLVFLLLICFAPFAHAAPPLAPIHHIRFDLKTETYLDVYSKIKGVLRLSSMPKYKHTKVIGKFVLGQQRADFHGDPPGWIYLHIDGVAPEDKVTLAITTDDLYLVGFSYSPRVEQLDDMGQSRTFFPRSQGDEFWGSLAQLEGDQPPILGQPIGLMGSGGNANGLHPALASCTNHLSSARTLLRDSLASCTTALRKHATDRKMVSRKNTLGVLDHDRLPKPEGIAHTGRKMIVATAGGDRAPCAP